MVFPADEVIYEGPEDQEHILTSYFAHHMNFKYSTEEVIEHKPFSVEFSHTGQFIFAGKKENIPTHYRGYQRDQSAQTVASTVIVQQTSTFIRGQSYTHTYFGIALASLELLVFGMLTWLYLAYDAREKDKLMQLPLYIQ